LISISAYRCSAIAVFVLCSGLVAQPPVKATHGATPPSTAPKDLQLDRHVDFGFRYQIPYGWVDRTSEMNNNEMNAQETPKPDSNRKEEIREQAGDGAKVLLGVFERPPEAAADSINSGVVIASESAASYPNLKRAEDYVGPLTEVATAKGFKSVGEPFSLEIESRRLVRADFAKSLDVRLLTSESLKNPLTMRQRTLIWMTKGRILSFTFIAESEEALDDIMDGLHFGDLKLPGR
jgi:hypothetical protein